MARVIVGEAGVYATVLTLRANYGHWAAGTVLYHLHVLIRCKLLSILQSQKSKVLIGTNSDQTFMLYLFSEEAVWQKLWKSKVHARNMIFFFCHVTTQLFLQPALQVGTTDLQCSYLVPLYLWSRSSCDDGNKCSWLARLYTQVLSGYLDGGRSWKGDQMS